MNLRPQNILIIGAGHGLGLALTQECKKMFPTSSIFTTFRRKELSSELMKQDVSKGQIDPLDELKVQNFCESLPQLDLVINCVGTLELEINEKIVGPEKSLKDINTDNLVEIFKINSFVTPLWAKFLKSKFSKENPSVFSTLSAMVGSITENEIGGWYGYRASKAALNMFLKNIAIEYTRSRLKTSVVGIHPGTTRTKLSSNYLKSVKHKVWEPNEAAKNIIRVLTSCPAEGTGLFKNWDGRTISF